MEFMSGRLVVAKIHELTCVQVEKVGPVSVFAARVEHDEFFIVTGSGGSEPTLIAASRHYLRNRITPRILRLTTLVDGIDYQVC